MKLKVYKQMEIAQYLEHLCYIYVAEIMKLKVYKQMEIAKKAKNALSHKSQHHDIYNKSLCMAQYNKCTC